MPASMNNCLPVASRARKKIEPQQISSNSPTSSPKYTSLKIYSGNQLENRDPNSTGYVRLDVILEIKNAVFRLENEVTNSSLLYISKA